MSTTLIWKSIIEMKISDWLSFASFVIASLALFYTYLSNTKKYELSNVVRKEILDWYSKSVEVLIMLKSEVQVNQFNIPAKNELLAKLSVQIEIGRFYFPNVDKSDGFGSDKQSAYQGYRNVTLEFLVHLYDIFNKTDANIYIEHIEYLQRHFTSHIFDILNPRKFLKETKKYTTKIFSKEFSLEDFLKKTPGSYDIFRDLW